MSALVSVRGHADVLNAVADRLERRNAALRKVRELEAV